MIALQPLPDSAVVGAAAVIVPTCMETAGAACMEHTRPMEAMMEAMDMMIVFFIHDDPIRDHPRFQVLPSLSSRSASATTSFSSPETLTDSFGLCAFEIGSSGPVTSTCASGKIFCS